MFEVQLYITRKDNSIKIVYTFCLLLYILYKTYKYIIFGEFWIFQKQVQKKKNKKRGEYLRRK